MKSRLKTDKEEWSKKIRQRVIFAMIRIIEKRIDVKSRASFAQRIHTQPASISRWENETGFPTIENIADICTEFAISPDWLMMGRGQMFGDAEIVVRLSGLEKRMELLEAAVGIKKEKPKSKT